jgi:hypothetical protein
MPVNPVSWSVTGGTISGSSTGNSVTVLWNSGYAYTSGEITIVEDNGTCTTTSEFSIAITPQIDPATDLSGSTVLSAYTQGVAYTVSPDVAGNSYSWNITGGTGSSSTSTISVDWGGDAVGNVSVTISSPGCDSRTLDLAVTLNPILLAGEVKYWNNAESPMPSPFNTNFNGMTVPDYFYVTLVENGTDVETDSVAPYWFTPTSQYLSYFKFAHHLNPANTYKVRVWDGGYLVEQNKGGGFPNGTLGQNWTWNNWGGVNATDALLINHMVVGHNITTTPYFPIYWMNYLTPAGLAKSYGPYADKLANTNNSATSPTNNGITALDALYASRRSVGYLSTYPGNKPNFEVMAKMVDEAHFNTNLTFLECNNYASGPDKTSWLPPIQFTKATTDNYLWSTLAIQHKYTSQDIGTIELGANYLNIYYTAVGDINSSYVPAYGGFKESSVGLEYEGVKKVNKGEEIILPIRIDRPAEIGAVSLGLTYRKDLIEVTDLNYSEEISAYDNKDGNLRIAWTSLNGLSLMADDSIMLIKVRVLADIDANTRLFELDGYTELADPQARIIDYLNLKSVSLSTAENSLTGDITLMNYPNPFNNQTTIRYNLPESGKVELAVYNTLGVLVKTLVDGIEEAGGHTITMNRGSLTPGVYYYRLILRGTQTWTATKEMVVTQ